MNVVITGTTTGLGHALLTTFRRAEHDVIGSKQPLDAASIDPMEPILELSDTKSIEQYAVHVMGMFDTIDVLINNAGVNAIRAFEDLDADFIRYIMDVNCIGPVLLTRHLLPILRGGLVLNITSDAAWRPMRHSLAYNCSKAAFDMATKQMARELTKPYDLQIIGLRPGKMCGTQMSHYIDQEVCNMRNWTKEEAYTYFVNNSVTGREVPVMSMAHFIHDLVTSDLARKCMSGACLDLVG